MQSRLRSLTILFVMAIFLLSGCFTSANEMEYDEYTGTISQPNQGKRTLTLNTVYLKVWYNTGEVEGSGKAVLDDNSQFAGDTTFTDTYILKFTGKYDQKSGLISGLVAVSGGNVCKSNCTGTSNTTYNHSSYWQAQVGSGKLLNGKISARPDYSLTYFTFEGNEAKVTK